MLTPWQQAVQPNERVHIDLYGPLQGDPIYKYVAVMSCAFTKWVEVVPIPNKEAMTVAKAVFEEWICRRGVMQLLVSDGGKEFANQILEELCRLMQAEKHVVSPYHPMANGQVERFNRDMRKYLMTMVEDTSDWVSYLKPLQFAHNTAINKSTKFTPHYLTFLSDPRLPDTLDYKHVTYSPTYAADAYRRLQYAYKTVYSNNEEARNAYTTHFNKKTRARIFDEGDEVLVTFPVNPKVSNKKLSFTWRGPFTIISKIGENILELKSSPRSKAIKVHVNRVKLFHRILDTAVKQRITEPQVTHPSELTQKVDSDDDDDDNDYDNYDEDINDLNQVLQVPLLQQQVPLPQPQPIQQLPQVPVRDLLAGELFGRQLCSRGPVQQQELPKRPLEYKRYTRK
jgi:hypothetical protein